MEAWDRDNAAGRGTVAFERAGARTVLRAARAASPLQLLTPRNHGHAAWVVVAGLGGGLVDGDALHLDVDVGRGAAGVLGTQASTKVYRCPARTCRQDLHAQVGEEGTLVAIPDPVACFAGARYEQTVRVALAASASLVLVDAFTAGRSARGERWDFLRYASRTTVTRADAPRFLDAVLLDPAHGALRTRMGRFDAFATLVVLGPRAAGLRAAALAAPAPPTAALVTASSPLGDDGAVVRFAGTSVETVTAALRARLTGEDGSDGLDAMLGDDPFARKW